MRLTPLLVALFLAALLACAHIYAVEHYLYWEYRWFDIPMHMLGGATLGCLALGLFGKYRPIGYLLFIAAAAAAWEGFEYIFGITGVSANNYVWDTAHDVLNDAVGAAFVYVVARYTVWRTQV
jgi:hypothetical protein